ncbi:Hypothetical protein UVM_LOCUS35 [uncultured virus]|nr:Hypothetical protein UVM_LOCUS35 [uncultured virus]
MSQPDEDSDGSSEEDRRDKNKAVLCSACNQCNNKRKRHTNRECCGACPCVILGAYQRAYQRAYQITPVGKFKRLANSARNNAKERGLAPLRAGAAVCTIDAAYVQNLWAEQGGRCHHTGIEMQFDGNKPWAVSLERLDPSGGYTRDGNVVLIVCELNHARTWSREKLHSIATKQVEPVDMDALASLVADARNVTKRARKPRCLQEMREAADGTFEFSCTTCDQFKGALYFPKTTKRPSGIAHCCKACKCASFKDTRSTLRGFVGCLVRNAYSRSCRRRERKRSRINLDACSVPTLTMDDVFAKIEFQKGRCFYSDIPMAFKSDSDWTCSLERIDENLGYTNENVVLVCFEFNTVKQLNRAKVAYIVEALARKAAA